MDLGLKFSPVRNKLMGFSLMVRSIAVALLLVLLAGGYYGLFYVEMEEEVAARRSQAQELQRQLANVRVVARNLEEFEREILELEQEFESALSQLPNRKQFEDLLQDITTAGKKVGVQIKSIQRDPEVERDFYAEVPFRIELEGEYHGLAMFFERLAQLPRIVNMGTFRIRTLDESGEGTVLRVEGQATTYRFLPPREDVS